MSCLALLKVSVCYKKRPAKTSYYPYAQMHDSTNVLTFHRIKLHIGGKITTTMKTLLQLFKSKKNGIVLRFSKSLNEWQVYSSSKLVYVGSKENCQNFIANMQSVNLKQV